METLDVLGDPAAMKAVQSARAGKTNIDRLIWPMKISASDQVATWLTALPPQTKKRVRTALAQLGPGTGRHQRTAG